MKKPGTTSDEARVLLGTQIVFSNDKCSVSVPHRHRDMQWKLPIARAFGGRALVGVYALLLAAMLTLAGGNCAQAQTSGTIVGTVTDSSGAVVSGASVQLTNTGTGAVVERTTNSMGEYNFVALPPGQYRIRGSHPGFSPVVVSGITLEVNQTSRYDLKLPVGATQQTVTVHSNGAVLQTETSDVGQVIDNTQITHLPLNGRNFLQLASLTNGVASQGARGASYSAGPQYTSVGGRVTQNSILVDGTEMRLAEEGGYGVNVSVDALQEFKIEQNNPPAQYGRGTSIVDAVIKSGTNQFHGTAFEFIRNEAFDARYINDTRGRKPEFRQNQFGANLGGPIFRDKTFFFVNYEGMRFHSVSTLQGNVPTPNLLKGDISGLTGVVDPDTGQPFQNNQIPSARISKFAAAMVPYYPAPNSDLPGLNYEALTSSTTNNDQGIVKIDHNLTANDHLFASMVLDNSSILTPGLLPYTSTASSIQVRPLATIQYNHIFTPNLLNVFRIGYFDSQVTVGFAGPKLSGDPTKEFGLSNLSPSPDSYAPPRVNISGYSAIGAGPWEPSGATDINRQLHDQVSYIHGRHSMIAGIDMRLIRYNDLGYATQVGSYTFSKGQPFGSGNAFVDFLLGIPTSGFGDQNGGDYGYNVNTQHGEFSFFGQDNIQVTHRLKLNLGLRYEYVQWPREVHNEFTNYIPSKNIFQFAGKQVSDRMLPPDRNNWGPRIGFAYRPGLTDKTVFRGGFGVMYGNFRGYEITTLHYNPPFVLGATLNNSKAGGAGTYPNYQYTIANFFPAPPTDPNDVNLKNVLPTYQEGSYLPRQLQWNFGIEHQLGYDTVLTIQYLGMKSNHQPMRFDGNPAAATTGDDYSSSPQSRRPYPWVSGVLGVGFRGYSNYNGLAVKVEKRYSHGLDLLATYTWAKAMGFNSANNYSVEDPSNIRRDYGASDTDIRNRATIAYIYDLPFGRGKEFLATANPFVQALAGGWHWSGIADLMSGGPLTLNQGTTNGFAFSSPGVFLPNVTGDPNAGHKTRTHAFNTDVVEAAAYGRYGNSSINNVRGFPFYYFDTALLRSITLHDRAHLQLRAEFFNVLNHPNYSSVNVNLSSPSFGQSLGATAQREIQFGAKFIF